MGSKNELPKMFYGMELDEDQVAFVEAIKDLSKTIVFCDAPAGTGKTTLAMGAANLLVQDKRNELDGSCISYLPTVRASRATCRDLSPRRARSTTSLLIRP